MLMQGRSSLPKVSAQLEGCWEEVRASGYSKSTLKKKRTTLRALLHWLEQNDADDAITEERLTAFLERIPLARQEQRRIESAG